MNFRFYLRFSTFMLKNEITYKRYIYMNTNYSELTSKF